MEESYVMTVEDKERRFKELYLCHCGYSVCHPDHTFGPAVRPNYIIHYVLKGQGEYHISNRTYALGKEEGFLIEPNEMTTYCADHADPWMYLWIGFGGTEVKKLLEDIGISSRRPTFSGQCGAQLWEIVKNMLGTNANGVEKELFLQMQLYQFLTCLTNGLSVRQGGFLQAKQNYYVYAAVEFIRANYAEDIKVQDIADYVGISRNYLATLFQRILKTSPNEYLARFRITRSKEQLTITDLPISTIASVCGYRDSLVFSKAFKQQVGMTPTQYRKTNREQQRMSIKQMKEKKQ